MDSAQTQQNEDARADTPNGADDTSSVSKPPLSRLRAMRKDPEGTCADVVLCSNGTIIRAHRAVLCTYEYFRKLFGTISSFVEARSRRVEFRDVSPEALQAVVDFVYEIPLDREADPHVLHEVWSFATLHLMTDLVECVRDLLLDLATPGTIIQVFRLGVRLQDTVAIAGAANYIVSTLETHYYETDLLEFSPEEFEALQEYCTPSVLPIFCSLVLKWMTKDSRGRCTLAEKLLEDIDFDQMSSTTLAALNRAVVAARIDQPFNVYQRLHTALISRMERILQNSSEILHQFKDVSVSNCWEDVCGTAVCTFARVHYNSRVSCSRCHRGRCEGVFSSVGTCEACGRQMNNTLAEPLVKFKNFAKSVDVP